MGKIVRRGKLFEGNYDHKGSVVKLSETEKGKGVLAQIAEKQNSLLATTKAWSEAIDKKGYVE